MSNLGLLTYYLNIKVEQGKDTITLHQSSYTKKVLKKSGLADCKPCQMPMDEKLKLSKGSSTEWVDAT